MPLPDGEYHPVPPQPSGVSPALFDQRGVLRYHFDGIIEAVESALAGKHSGQHHIGNSSRKEAAGYGWDFGVGFDGAVRLAYEGWQEGRENVEELATQIREDIERTSIVSYARPLIVADVAGSIANVPAYIAGVPDSMFDWHLEEQSAPIVHIVIETTASAGISAEFYSVRGSAVVALIDMLETAGRRCEVTLVDTMFSGWGGGHMADVRTTLKRPGDHLQLDSLAYAICHPGYFRRIGFAHIENLPPRQAEALTSANYGTPVPTLFDRGDLFMPPVSTEDKEWANGEGARKWVVERLKEHGVVIE